MLRAIQYKIVSVGLFVFMMGLAGRALAVTPTFSDTVTPTESATQTSSPTFTNSPSPTPTPTVTGTYLPGQYLSILPPTGPSSGGQFVTVTGGVFFPSHIIMFDGVTLTSLTYIDAFTMAGVAPAHAPGPVTVTAYSFPFANDFFSAFTYLAPLTPTPTSTFSPTTMPPVPPQSCSSTVKVPGRNVHPLNVPIGVVDSQGGPIALRVFSSHGRFVRDIYKGELGACQGLNLTWDCLDHRGAPVASGLYILVLRRGEEIVMRKRFIIVH